MSTSAEHRRGAGFLIACCAGAGAALVVLVCLPQLMRLGSPAAVLLSVLAVAELVAVVTVMIRPGWRWLITAAAGAVVLLWLVTEVGRVGPDPWFPVNATVGLTSRIVIALQLLAVVGSLIRRRTGWWRWLIAAPIVALSLIASAVGLIAASNGFNGSPLPIAKGTPTTMEYCRLDGLPLAMDLYRPPGSRPEPVVLYVHGGGFMLGNRTLRGPWSSAHDEALFTPVRERLNARAIAVASIDYRLLPASDWRAPVEDAKCAVRFLRAHATQLGIDGSHIGVWGSSAGGTIVSLLALSPDFTTSQYGEQPSTVQAVVDMFGPSDLTNLNDSGGFARTVARLALGRDQNTRRALSPLHQVAEGAPPFLILHGQEDTDMPIRHSQQLATRLTQAGVPVTFIPVEGTGHALSASTETPAPGELADTVTSFLARTLR
ncbi:alpha/beta hydrolase [Kribbella sp. NPDC026611]|uniref:alpha/beta hydrolase n=1 Tax=Kribbella sp. NPDC026611 TaxID=3154911 RepID=UPI0033D359D5